MYYIEKIALWLTIIGGLNWGLIGLFDFNLVAAIFGGVSMLTRLIYILVGLASLWLIYTQIVPEKVVVVKK